MVDGSRQIFSFFGCTYLTIYLVSLIFCQNPKAPIKAVERVKSFGHSRLTETEVTRNKSDIGGKLCANVFHKGGVPENASVSRHVNYKT